MRFLFLDEAGTSANEPVCVVACVIANADEHIILAENAIREIMRGVPEQFRNQEFHATDIFGNSAKYGDHWALSDRLQLLAEMMSLPRRLGMAVVIGMVRKDAEVPEEFLSVFDNPKDYHHMLSFRMAISHADRFIRRNCGVTEIGTAVAEDKPEMRRNLKYAPKHERMSPWVAPQSQLLPTAKEEAQGYVEQTGEQRVERVRDTVHFVGKGDEPLVWLADACAFGLRRYFAQQKFGDRFVRAILNHEPNLYDYRGPASQGCWPFGKFG